MADKNTELPTQGWIDPVDSLHNGLEALPSNYLITWLDWINAYPAMTDLGATLLVGIVGFGGVLLTLKSNAKLARKQQREGVIQAQRQREEEQRHQRETLRAGFITELGIHRDSSI